MEHGRNPPLDIDVSWDGVVATVTRGQRTGHRGHPLTRRLLAVAAGRGEQLVLELSELVLVDVAGDLCHPGAPFGGVRGPR